MRTATVRDLRTQCTRLLGWLEAGEEILVTLRGKTIAKLVPAQDVALRSVDWTQSPALKRDRSTTSELSSADSLELIQEAAGRW